MKLTHLLVHEPEGNRLISDQSLIVTFGITDTLLPPATVCQRVHYVTYHPIIIPLLLEEFDPHVGYGHRETVIEAESTNGWRYAQERHPRHIFSNGDSVGVQLVDEVVSLKARFNNRIDVKRM